MKNIGQFLLKIWGWRIEISPKVYSIQQGIFAVCPHTTWLDFPLGLLTRSALKLSISYLGKAELFKGPFGWMFRALGGTPVERQTNNNMVDAVAGLFKNNPNLKIALAPEGTRKPTEKLRTGFYYMALQAQVPIIMVSFDLAQKKICVAEPFWPSGHFKEDMMRYFVPFFDQVSSNKKAWIEKYKNDQF